MNFWRGLHDAVVTNLVTKCDYCNLLTFFCAAWAIIATLAFSALTFHVAYVSQKDTCPTQNVSPLSAPVNDAAYLPLITNCACPVCPEATGAALYIAIERASIAISETVRVDVRLVSGKQFMEVETCLAYNPTVLCEAGVVQGDWIAGRTRMRQPGVVCYDVASKEPVSGSGVLFGVLFAGVSAGTATLNAQSFVGFINGRVEGVEAMAGSVVVR